MRFISIPYLAIALSTVLFSCKSRKTQTIAPANDETTSWNKSIGPDDLPPPDTTRTKKDQSNTRGISIGPPDLPTPDAPKTPKPNPQTEVPFPEMPSAAISMHSPPQLFRQQVYSLGWLPCHVLWPNEPVDMTPWYRDEYETGIFVMSAEKGVTIDSFFYGNYTSVLREGFQRSDSAGKQHLLDSFINDWMPPEYIKARGPVQKGLKMAGNRRVLGMRISLLDIENRWQFWAIWTNGEYVCAQQMVCPVAYPWPDLMEKFLTEVTFDE